jgi:hypothetical protein
VKSQYIETLQIANVEMPTACGKVSDCFAKPIGIPEEITLAMTSCRLSRAISMFCSAAADIALHMEWPLMRICSRLEKMLDPRC